MGYLLIAYRHLHRHRGDTIRTMDEVVFGRVGKVSQCCTYIVLDAFGHALTHAHVVLSAHILLYVASEVVTSHLDRVVRYDTAE